MIVQSTDYCPHCMQRRLLAKRSPNRVVHAILTVATVGGWAPIWFIIEVASAGNVYRCQRCGTEVKQ